MTLRVGLTGGIGSGKSTVAKIFALLGVPVFDADSTAKYLMENDTRLVQSVSAAFGAEAYNNGKLNRSYLASIVFSDAHKLDMLNTITHPITLAAFRDWVDKQSTTTYVIKEAALLFEAGAGADLDIIIGVYTPQVVRIQRVMQRDHVEREAVIARMEKQINEEIKMKLCDFVVVNDAHHLVLPQVLQLHEKLLASAQQRQQCVE